METLSTFGDDEELKSALVDEWWRILGAQGFEKLWGVKREELGLGNVGLQTSMELKKKLLKMDAHTESLNFDYGFPSSILRLECTREKQGPPFHLIIMSFGEGGGEWLGEGGDGDEPKLPWKLQMLKKMSTPLLCEERVLM